MSIVLGFLLGFTTAAFVIPLIIVIIEEGGGI